MNHNILRPFIVKVSVFGYFPLNEYFVTYSILIYLFEIL